jgi:hypothetical protein
MVQLDQVGGRRILDNAGSLLAEAVDPAAALRLVRLINIAEELTALVARRLDTSTSIDRPWTQGDTK